MRNEIDFWEKRNESSFVFLNGTKPERSGVYITVSVLTWSEARWDQMKGAKQHVAQKSDRFTFPLLVLSQAERPGRALAGGTSGGLHLQQLRGLLSADHAERAGEAAGHSSLINIARSSCISLRHSQQSKSVDEGYGVGKTVDGDGQRLSGGRPRIAGEALDWLWPARKRRWSVVAWGW
jgi:hypothetical protein